MNDNITYVPKPQIIMFFNIEEGKSKLIAIWFKSLTYILDLPIGWLPPEEAVCSRVKQTTWGSAFSLELL